MTTWTLADAYELLAVAQSFNGRKVADLDAEAWRRALHGLRLEDCKQAVIEHFTVSTEWLMPAHVRAGVGRIRKARLEQRAYDWVPDADPDDPIAYQRALRSETARAADGTEKPRDMRAISGIFREVPKVNPSAIEGARQAIPRRRPRTPDMTYGEAMEGMARTAEVLRAAGLIARPGGQAEHAKLAEQTEPAPVEATP